MSQAQPPGKSMPERRMRSRPIWPWQGRAETKSLGRRLRSMKWTYPGSASGPQARERAARVTWMGEGLAGTRPIQGEHHEGAGSGAAQRLRSSPSDAPAGPREGDRAPAKTAEVELGLTRTSDFRRVDHRPVERAPGRCRPSLDPRLRSPESKEPREGRTAPSRRRRTSLRQGLSRCPITTNESTTRRQAQGGGLISLASH